MLRYVGPATYEIAWSSRRPPSHTAIRAGLNTIPPLQGATIEPLSISKRNLWKDVKEFWQLHVGIAILSAGISLPVYPAIALWECYKPLWIITFTVSYPVQNPLRISTPQSAHQDTPLTALPHTEGSPAGAPSPDVVVHW